MFFPVTNYIFFKTRCEEPLQFRTMIINKAHGNQSFLGLKNIMILCKNKAGNWTFLLN